MCSKGTNDETIFFDDHDRAAFLLQLARAAEKYGWIVLAYCLMSNHYHLVLRVPNGGLSAGMQELNRGYSWRTNRRYGRRMHLFRQRFWSTEVKTGSHLLEASRYAVLNPVKAGICRYPDEWPWSSYRATAGLSPEPRFLAVDELLGLFGRDLENARRAYVEFVQAGLAPVSETDLAA